MDKMNSLLNIFLIISCLFQSGVSANSMISCPATFLKEKPSTLQLSIDNSTFSVCDIKPTTVTCRWSPVNATESVICSGSVTRCEKGATSPRCPCDEESAQGYTYTFDFSMLPNQNRGSISCDLDCTVLSPGGAVATVDAGTSCQNVNFVSKCDVDNQCVLGYCRIDANGDDVCDCTGTGYIRPICEAMDPFVIILIVVSIVCVVCIGVVVAYVVFGPDILVIYCSVAKLYTHEQRQALINYLVKTNVCPCATLYVTICRVLDTNDPKAKGKMAVILESRCPCTLWNAYWKARRYLGDLESSEPDPNDTLEPIDPSEPAAYNNTPRGTPMAQPKYTGNGNGQPKKSKSNKAIPLSSVGRSSPPSETSGDEKTHMILPTKGRALPKPGSTGIGKSASPRLDPLNQDHSKMTSVERNSGAFPRKLPSPGQPPLDPIPSGKKS